MVNKMVQYEALARQARERSQEGSGQLAENRGIKGAGALCELRHDAMMAARACQAGIRV